jgi:hypothetical protein
MLVLGMAVTVLTLFLAAANPGFTGAWPVVMLGLTGALTGLGWMIRIYRSRPETSKSTWRSRDRAPVPIPLWSRNGHSPKSSEMRAGSMREDVARAQETARAMIALALFLGGLLFFLWIAAPGFSVGTFYEPTWQEIVLPWAGWVLYLTGLAWMIRIYRSRPETSETDWRYRSGD